MLKPLATTPTARLAGKTRPGSERQPSSPSSSSSELQGGVDDMAQNVVDVVGEHAQTHAELRRGETYAGSFEHRVGGP